MIQTTIILQDEKFLICTEVKQCLEKIFKLTSCKINMSNNNCSIEIPSLDRRIIIMFNEKGIIQEFNFYSSIHRHSSYVYNDNTLYHILFYLHGIIDRIYLTEKVDNEMKSIINTLHCINGLCPVCNSEINNLSKSLIVRVCDNNCYYISTYTTHNIDMVVKIFNTRYEILSFDPLDKKIELIQKIYTQIKSWKYNDQYLSEILKNS